MSRLYVPWSERIGGEVLQVEGEDQGTPGANRGSEDVAILFVVCQAGKNVVIGVENYVVFPAQTCRSLAMESAQGACR